MGIRVICPECDTVFEPPAGVWSAQCPFCGRESEVPHAVQSIDSSKVRKRLRKPPGWLIVLLNHMPPWGSRVLISSFCLMLASFLMQTWTSAHSDQSKIAMQRAIRGLNLARSEQKPDALLKAIDATIQSWTTDSAQFAAQSAGLDRDSLKNERRFLARLIWSNALKQLQESPDDALSRLDAAGELADSASADQDLYELKPEAVRFWTLLRDDQVARHLGRSRELSQAQKAAESADELTASVAWNLKTRPEVAINAQLRAAIEAQALALAQSNGIVVASEMIRTVFTDLDHAALKIMPLVEKNLRDRNYVLLNSKDEALNQMFRDASKFRLVIKIDERFGRPFEDTPHRTTLVDTNFILSDKSKIIWQQTASARTPRIPARTSMGMSRLQLSKRSDEKVERKLSEATWESVPAGLNQTLQLLPQASQGNPSTGL